jgi:hypothetical protein
MAFCDSKTGRRKILGMEELLFLSVSLLVFSIFCFQ